MGFYDRGSPVLFRVLHATHPPTQLDTSSHSVGDEGTRQSCSQIAPVIGTVRFGVFRGLSHGDRVLGGRERTDMVRDIDRLAVLFIDGIGEVEIEFPAGGLNGDGIDIRKNLFDNDVRHVDFVEAVAEDEMILVVFAQGLL